MGQCILLKGRLCRTVGLLTLVVPNQDFSARSQTNTPFLSFTFSSGSLETDILWFGACVLMLSLTHQHSCVTVVFSMDVRAGKSIFIMHIVNNPHSSHYEGERVQKVKLFIVHMPASTDPRS